MKGLHAILAGAICLYSCSAFSEQDDWETLQKTQAAFSCTLQQSQVGKLAHVTMACDRDKIIAELPILQRIGLINPELTQAQINVSPSVISMAFLIEDAAAMIPAAYKALPIDQSTWTIDLEVSDDYGHVQTKNAFTFRFDKALMSRINWERFNAQNLPKIAPGFQFSSWLQSEISSEGQ